MTLVYSQLFDASHSGRVLCMSFQALGKYIVVGTNNCITLWNVDVGSPLVEDLCLLSDPLSIAWISGLVFVVGCSDGSLCSFKIIPNTQEVQISGFFASEGPIHHLSCDATGSVLVSASSGEISIWARTQTNQHHIHWVRRNTLAGPDSQISTQKIVSLACFIKLEHRLRSVLLIYERQVKIVDIDTLSTLREYNVSGLVVSGALLSNEDSFMTVIEDGAILIWRIETGASTSLDKSKRFPASVRFIHREQLMLIGGHGRADIVGAESMYKTQTLWHVEKQQTSTLSRTTSWRLSRRVLEDVDVPQVDFLAVGLPVHHMFWHSISLWKDSYSDANNVHLIATASSRNGQVIVWKGSQSSSITLRPSWQYLQLRLCCLLVTGIIFVFGLLLDGARQKAILLAFHSFFNHI